MCSSENCVIQPSCTVSAAAGTKKKKEDWYNLDIAVVASLFQDIRYIVPCASFTRPVMMMTIRASTLATVEMTWRTAPSFTFMQFAQVSRPESERVWWWAVNQYQGYRLYTDSCTLWYTHWREDWRYIWYTETAEGGRVNSCIKFCWHRGRAQSLLIHGITCVPLRVDRGISTLRLATRFNCWHL